MITYLLKVNHLAKPVPASTKATKKASFDQRSFKHPWFDVVSLFYC